MAVERRNPGCCSRVWLGLREQTELYRAVLTKDGGAAPSVLSALLCTRRRGGTKS